MIATSVAGERRALMRRGLLRERTEMEVGRA
jgi:hypothetical protein